MSISHRAIHDYFTQYAASLTQLDAQAGAQLWSTPGMIVDDQFSGVLNSREKMVQGLEQSYPFYQQLGLDSVDFELIDQTHLTDALVLAQVQWKFFEAGGAPLTASTAYYLLRAEAEGLLACVCIQTDDVEKLQALASARGIDFPGAEI